MFEALMVIFNEPNFWTLVVAVMVGYILIRSLPYVFVAALYIAAAIAWLMGMIIAVIAGTIIYLWTNAKIFYKSLQDEVEKRNKA